MANTHHPYCGCQRCCGRSSTKTTKALASARSALGLDPLPDEGKEIWKISIGQIMAARRERTLVTALAEGGRL